MKLQQTTCILHKASTVYRTELSEEAQQASFFTEGTRGKNMAMPPSADGPTEAPPVRLLQHALLQPSSDLQDAGLVLPGAILTYHMCCRRCDIDSQHGQWALGTHHSRQQDS